jgi:hypothetical protein
LKRYCSFFLGSAAINEMPKPDLTGYKVSKGAIQSPPTIRWLEDLERRIVRMRIGQNDVRGKVGRADPA